MAYNVTPSTVHGPLAIDSQLIQHHQDRFSAGLIKLLGESRKSLLPADAMKCIAALLCRDLTPGERDWLKVAHDDLVASDYNSAFCYVRTVVRMDMDDPDHGGIRNSVKVA